MAYGKGKRKLIGFVAVLWDHLNSKAYKSMTPKSQVLFIYFLGKPKVHPLAPEHTEIAFEFTYREAEKCGYSSSTFSRCIRELMDKGFIDPVWKGGLRGDGKSSSKFRLSHRWKEYGRQTFKVVQWNRVAENNTLGD